ncbi:hypothetical protein [Nocardioides sp. KR10-350]|uniref:hypothetical protein n=1 Tax=Nocardioides cheoyonin TaxID=3156615 RepID=UPI0032B490B0
MSMERARRARFTNMAPTAGEFAIAFVFVGLFVFIITPLVVQGAVCWAAEGHFAWPTKHLLDAYGGLLHGHFGSGLAHGRSDGLPADALMWVLTLVGEAISLGATVVVAIWIRDLTGSGSRHGLATATQAAQALGVGPLRKRAGQIRPDLYARSKRKALLR